MTQGRGPGLSLLHLASLPAPEPSVRIPAPSIFSPGPTEPGFSRSASRGRSLGTDPPCLRKVLGLCPRTAALEGLTWVGPALVLSLLPVQDYTFPTTRAINSFSDSCLARSFRSHMSSPFTSWYSDPGARPPGRCVPFPLQRPEGAFGGDQLRPRPASARSPVGSACLGHMSLQPASPGQAPCHPCRPCRPPSPPPPPAACPSRSSSRRRGAALRCLRPGLGRGLRRSRPPRRAPGPRARARAMGLWLPPPPAPPG